MTYDLKKATITVEKPILAFNTVIDNWTSKLPSAQAIGYSYARTDGGTWTHAKGNTIGWKGTANVGIPSITDSKMEISVSPAQTFDMQWGRSYTTTTIITETTTVNVAANKKARAIVSLKNVTLDVPFTCAIKTLLANGQTIEEKETGVFKTRNTYEVEVSLKDI
jgi:hypothetical protein